MRRRSSPSSSAGSRSAPDAGTLRVWTSATDARGDRRCERSASRRPVTPTGWRSTSTATSLSLSGRPGSRSARWPTARSDVSTSAFMEVWQDTSDPPDETFEEWAHWLIEAETFEPSLWFLALTRRRARGLLASAGRTATIQLPATSGCSASGVPGAGRASATRCCCTRFRRSGSVAGRAARSASTPRARPGRRGCTSGPGCASTATRSFSSGQSADRVRLCRAFAPAAPTAGR